MQPKAKQEFEKENGYLILNSRDNDAYFFKAADIVLIHGDGEDYTNITYRTGADTTDTYGFEIPCEIVFDCKMQAETTGKTYDLRKACNSELDASRPSTKGKLMAKVVRHTPVGP